MNTREKIEKAKERIKELELLIKLWSKDEIDQVFAKDDIEPTLTEIILEQKNYETN